MTALISAYRSGDHEFLDMNNPETLNHLRQNFPAVMADHPSEKMSGDYNFFPSYKIADALQNKFGFQLAAVSQQQSRKRDPRFTEHVMRFRFPSAMGKLKNVGDSQPELVLMNSHNGRSQAKFFAGIFRLVCSNGMVISETSFGKIQMRHFGANNSFQEFGKVMESISQKMQIMDARMQRMNEIILHPYEQNQLALMLMQVRKVPTWVQTSDVLKARRSEDERTEDGFRSLWVTWNVLQENLTNREIDPQVDTPRARSMRRIESARNDLLMNEALWLKLDEFIATHFADQASEMIDLEATLASIESAAKAAERRQELLSKLVEDAQEIGEEPSAGDEEPATEEPALEPAAEAPAEVASFDELMQSGSYQDLVNLGTEGLTSEQKKKLSSRKSYLKKKESVDA